MAEYTLKEKKEVSLATQLKKKKLNQITPVRCFSKAKRIDLPDGFASQQLERIIFL